MKSFRALLLGVATFLFIQCALEATDLQIGFVNFKTCLEKSKQGQQEKNAFDALKKQMSDALEKTDRELVDLAKKLEDQDYLDGLSPAAEEELKNRFQGLSQEFARAQNQYYQLLNQANFRLVQNLHDHVSKAAEYVREKNGLSLVLNEESTFAFSSSLNITDQVIAQMDAQFEQENNLNDAPTSPVQ